MGIFIFIPIFVILGLLLFGAGFIYLIFEAIPVVILYAMAIIFFIVIGYGINRIFSIDRLRNGTDKLRRIIFSILIILALLYFIIVTAMSEQYLEHYVASIYYQSYKGLFFVLVYIIIYISILLIIEIFGKNFNHQKKCHSIEFLMLCIGLIFSFIYCYMVQSYYYNERLNDISTVGETQYLQEITIKEDAVLYFDIILEYTKTWNSKLLVPSFYQVKEGEIYFTTREHFEEYGKTYIFVYNKSIKKWGYVPEEVLNYLI